MAGEMMRSRIEIERSFFDMMNLFFQCPDYDTHLGTLNAYTFIFTHRRMEVIKKYHLMLHLSISPHLFHPYLTQGRHLVKEAERERLEGRSKLR